MTNARSIRNRIATVLGRTDRHKGMDEYLVRFRLYGRPAVRTVFDSTIPNYALPVKPVMRVNRYRASQVDARYGDKSWRPSPVPTRPSL